MPILCVKWYHKIMIKYFRSVILVILGAFVIYSLSKTLLGYREKISFTGQYKQDYEEALKKNRRLKSDLVKAQDYHAVERAIRNKLNLSKPGEVVVIIPKPSPSPTPTPEVKKPVFQQWIEVFWGKSG